MRVLFHFQQGHWIAVKIKRLPDMERVILRNVEEGSFLSQIYGASPGEI